MNKDALKKIFIQSLSGFLSLALAIVLYFCLKQMGELRQSVRWLMDVLTPFVYGGAMAYLLKTPCGFMERQFEKLLPEKGKKLANVLAVVTVLVLSVLVIYLLLSMVLPEMARSVIALVEAIPPKLEELTQWITRHLEGNEMLQNYVNTGFQYLEDWLNQWTSTDLLPKMQKMMDGVLITVNSVAAAVGSVLTVVKNIVLGIIICIYLLLGRKRFARHGRALIYAVFKPERADKVLKECAYIDTTFVGFFGGKILDSAIVGLICYVFCAIMTAVAGFQNAVLISVIIGVTNVIPYFGPFIGAVPAALLILISSPRNCLIFLIFIVILQQFDGNVLGPKLLAGSVGLTGFWVLFSITLFQGLFGFMGILIGVPVFAVIYDLIRRAIVSGLKRHGKLDVLVEQAEKISSGQESAPEEEEAP